MVGRNGGGEEFNGLNEGYAVRQHYFGASIISAYVYPYALVWLLLYLKCRVCCKASSVYARGGIDISLCLGISPEESYKMSCIAYTCL